VKGLTLLLLGAALLGVPPTAGATPHRGPTAAISLGDSFISGEGGRWRGNSNDIAGSRAGTDLAWTGSTYDKALVYGTSAENGCHRSNVAEIRSADLPGIEQRFNLACSGAKTADVRSEPYQGEPPQVVQLRSIARTNDVKLVVLSIGGNDLGFSSVITECIKAWTFGQKPCHTEQVPELERKLPAAMDDVRDTVTAVKRTLRQAGYAREDYRFVLQSYPSPLPRAKDMRYPERGWSRLSTGGCPLWNADTDAARDELVPRIAKGLHGVAADTDVTFLDLRDAFDGREVCAKGRELATTDNPPDPTRSEWMRFVAGVAQGDVQESMHPNAYGQQALGRCLTLTFRKRAPDLACTPSRGGRGTNDMDVSPR
jgi:hypothetical protein